MKTKDDIYILMLEGFLHNSNNILSSLSFDLLSLKKGITSGDFHRKSILLLVDNILETTHDLKKEYSLLYNFYRPVSNVKEFDQIDLKTIIDKVLCSFANPEFQNQVKVNLFISSDQKYIVTGNESGIELALIEIIKNAFESAPLDRKPQVTINLIKNPKGCIVEINDNGIGINTQNLDYICDPFFTTKVGHKGIGLTLAKIIIENHKWEIKVSSYENVGTSVQIHL